MQSNTKVVVYPLGIGGANAARVLQTLGYDIILVDDQKYGQELFGRMIFELNEVLTLVRDQNLPIVVSTEKFEDVIMEKLNGLGIPDIYNLEAFQIASANAIIKQMQEVSPNKKMWIAIADMKQYDVLSEIARDLDATDIGVFRLGFNHELFHDDLLLTINIEMKLWGFLKGVDLLLTAIGFMLPMENMKIVYFPDATYFSSNITTCNGVFDLQTHLVHSEADFIVTGCKGDAKLLSTMQKFFISNKIGKKQLAVIPLGASGIDRLSRSISHNMALDIIIYAPTCPFRDNESFLSKNASLLKSGPKIIEALKENFPSHRILVRLHPSTTRRLSELPIKLLNIFKTIELDVSSDRADSYSRSATLITDASNTAYSFAYSTNRAPIFFEIESVSPILHFNSYFSCELAYISDRTKVGYVVSTVEALVKQTQNVIDDPLGLSVAIQKHYRENFYNPNNIAKYFIENIDYLLGNQKQLEWIYSIAKECD